MDNNKIKLSFGNVRDKKIITPNDFVSHMIEHLAWRLGLKIDLKWNNENWQELGKQLGKKIIKFQSKTKSSAALGMIDDGSAEVSIILGRVDLIISTTGGVNKNKFLQARCEQIANGKPLVNLLKGLSNGLGATIQINISSYEDPHHTWEGIFRAIGITLSEIFTPNEKRQKVNKKLSNDNDIKKGNTGEISVLKKGANLAKVRRDTAETGVTVMVNFNGANKATIQLEVADSISNALVNIEKMFTTIAQTLQAELKIKFQAKKLSSSHVVMEDIGLVLGRTLLEILKVRMIKYGVNGAGSNLQIPQDIKKNNVCVGINVEGRKFWRFISEDGEINTLRQNLLLGQKKVYDGLRTEDLDDFVDGLAGGLNASIIIQIKDYNNVDRTWQELFTALGEALNEVFILNPFRKCIPPGVKATLA